MTFTEGAVDKINEFMKNNPGEGNPLLRIAVTGQTLDNYTYQFSLDDLKYKQETDIIVDQPTFKVIVDPKTKGQLTDATIEWAETMNGSGFQVDNPNKPKANLQGTVEERINTLIEVEINPALAQHGGFVKLVRIEESKALVHMGGGCQGCGMAQATLRQGIESRIVESIPEIKEVVDATDHAAGNQPYYAPQG